MRARRVEGTPYTTQTNIIEAVSLAAGISYVEEFPEKMNDFSTNKWRQLALVADRVLDSTYKKHRTAGVIVDD